MSNRYLIPVATEAGSLIYQRAATLGLTTLRTSLYQIPQTIGHSDPNDDIDATQVANFLIGKTVYDTVTFMGNNPDGSLSYFDLTTQQVKTVAKMQLPIAFCTVTKKMNVIKSGVSGRNGTVKQFISLNDYEISIKGVFTTGVYDKYPEQAMIALQAITDCTTEVKVASNILNLFGINYIVFESCYFEQMDSTGRDEQRFNINCCSEIPFTINVNQGGGSTSNYSSFNGTVTAAPAPTVI